MIAPKNNSEHPRYTPANGYCQHCHTRAACRPRKLCFNCYYTPSIRSLYGAVSKFGVYGLGLEAPKRRLPSQPTRAEPGSEEKIAVMEERAARGEPIFHPDDYVPDRQYARWGIGYSLSRFAD